MLTREQAKEKLKGFETTGNFNDDNGVLLYIPSQKEFCAISFGDGTNYDSLEDDCDDYIYIETYVFNGSEELESGSDGGQLDFNTEESGYNGDITNAVYDALELIYGTVVDFIPLQNFYH